MARKVPSTSPVKQLQKAASQVARTHRPQITQPPRLRPWLGIILIVGLLLLTVASLVTWNWLKGLQINMNSTAAPPPATTLQVQRTLPYADLSFTVLNAQYATAFPGDPIHAGPATVRLNMRVTNPNTYAVTVIYYDIARLIAPKMAPVAPSNVRLSTGPQPGESETGWIDFPVAQNIQLSTLKLQLGSTALGETLVTIPLSGTFDGNQYAVKVVPQSLTIAYDFEGSTLTYHLRSVDVRYSYGGSESKMGQRFYVLNFTVDNNNGAAISPGYGYDYIRLYINGANRPPIDNTLPKTFKAGAQGVSGRVVYAEPAGLKSLQIVFLLQVVVGEQSYNINL
ncbi:MAG TPA: hypothetical protein VKV20_02180 [Ktedonobacteraceae bacterium]|jgi:hypothetical protein|nr:hypothetical protein [Ktedonobacteraceae bacterium]